MGRPEEGERVRGKSERGEKVGKGAGKLVFAICPWCPRVPSYATDDRVTS